MTRRLSVIFVLAAFLISISLTGCGSNSADGNESQTNASKTNQSGTNESEANEAAAAPADAQGGAVKLKFSSFQTGDVADDWEKKRFPDFKKETGIDVEHVFIKATDTISTLLMWNAANTMPDAGMLSANYENALAAKGMLVNLTEFIQTNDPDYDLSRFFPKLLDAYKYNGNLYALPSDLDLGLLWYNKDLFDKAGVSYPDENWTWDDYLNAAKKLTSGNGPAKIYGTEFPLPQTFLWQNGADILSSDGKNVTIDSPEATEAIAFIADLVNRHKVAPKPGSGQDKFQLGKAAMALGNGPWYAHYVLKDVKFKWGIAPLPRGKEKATTAYGSTFAIFSASKHQKEAWQFIKWFLSDEQQMIRARQFSWFPPASTVVQDPGFGDDSVLNMTAAQKNLVLKETDFGKAPIVTEKQNEVSQIVDRELGLVWSGEKKPQDAVQVIKSQVQPLLK